MRKRFALFTFAGALVRGWLNAHAEPSVIVAVPVGGYGELVSPVTVRIVVVGVRGGRGGRGGSARSLQSVEKPELTNIGFMLTV